MYTLNLFVLAKVCEHNHREKSLSLSDCLRTSVLRRSRGTSCLTRWWQILTERTTLKMVALHHPSMPLTSSTWSSRHRADNGSVVLSAWYYLHVMQRLDKSVVVRSSLEKSSPNSDMTYYVLSGTPNSNYSLVYVVVTYEIKWFWNNFEILSKNNFSVLFHRQPRPKLFQNNFSDKLNMLGNIHELQ